jgi:hypothetical protein
MPKLKHQGIARHSFGCNRLIQLNHSSRRLVLTGNEPDESAVEAFTYWQPSGTSVVATTNSDAVTDLQGFSHSSVGNGDCAMSAMGRKQT